MIDQWSVVSGQWSVVSGQWSVVSVATVCLCLPESDEEEVLYCTVYIIVWVSIRLSCLYVIIGTIKRNF